MNNIVTLHTTTTSTHNMILWQAADWRQSWWWWERSIMRMMMTNLWPFTWRLIIVGIQTTTTRFRCHCITCLSDQDHGVTLKRGHIPRCEGTSSSTTTIVIVDAAFTTKVVVVFCLITFRTNYQSIMDLEDGRRHVISSTTDRLPEWCDPSVVDIFIIARCGDYSINDIHQQKQRHQQKPQTIDKLESSIITWLTAAIITRLLIKIWFRLPSQQSTTIVNKSLFVNTNATKVIIPALFTVHINQSLTTVSPHGKSVIIGGTNIKKKHMIPATSQPKQQTNNIGIMIHIEVAREAFVWSPPPNQNSHHKKTKKTTTSGRTDVCRVRYYIKAGEADDGVIPTC